MTDDVPPEDRRRAPRVPVNAQFGDLDDVHYAGDLSARGVFLHTDRDLSTGDVVDLCFTVITDDPLVLRARGRIVRRQSDPPGVGIEFTALSAPMRERIARVLAHQKPRDTGPSLADTGVSDEQRDRDTAEAAPEAAYRRAEDLPEAHDLEIEGVASTNEDPGEAADTLMHLKPVDLEIVDDDEEDLDLVDTGQHRSGAAREAEKEEG